MPGSNRRFSGTLEHPPPRRDAMDRRHSNASDTSLPDSNHVRQLSQENIEYIPTRITKLTAPKPAANPLQFIKVGPATLYKSAQEQLKKVEEIKKVTKEVRDEAEDWQSNLDNWKSSRRKRQEHIIERVVEVKKFEMEEYDRNRRRSKTFNEMMEERNSRGRKVSLVVFQDDDANDLSDLGISTSSGKSSISEDYGNDDHHNANEREETKGCTNDTQRRNGVLEEDTSSVATASSPEPDEYTYERAIQGYVNFAETRVKSRSAVTNNNRQDSEEKSTLGINGEKLSNGHAGKTPPPTPRRPSAAKIEERLSALEQRRRSGSSNDLHSTDVKKPTISVPKVDILKRRELFERACESNNKPVLPSRKFSGDLCSPKHAKAKSSEGTEVKKENKITSEITSSVKERLTNLEKSVENGGSEKEVDNAKHRLSNGDVSVRDRLSHIEGQTLIESEAERIQTNCLSGDLSESIKERLTNLDSACNKDNNKKVTPDRDPGFQEKLANFRNTEVKKEDSECLVNGFDSQGKDISRPYSPEVEVYQDKKQQFHRSLDSLETEGSAVVCNEVFERVQSLEELECCNRARNSTEMIAFSSQSGDIDREDREDSGIHTADVSCSVSQADEPVEDSEIITTISSVVPHLETSSTGVDVLHLEVELVNTIAENISSSADASKFMRGDRNSKEGKNENKTDSSSGADAPALSSNSLVSHDSLENKCPLTLEEDGNASLINFEHATNTIIDIVITNPEVTIDSLEAELHKACPSEEIKKDEYQSVLEDSSPEVASDGSGSVTEFPTVEEVKSPENLDITSELYEAIANDSNSTLQEDASALLSNSLLSHDSLENKCPLSLEDEENASLINFEHATNTIDIEITNPEVTLDSLETEIYEASPSEEIKKDEDQGVLEEVSPEMASDSSVSVTEFLTVEEVKSPENLDITSELCETVANGSNSSLQEDDSLENKCPLSLDDEENASLINFEHATNTIDIEITNPEVTIDSLEAEIYEACPSEEIKKDEDQNVLEGTSGSLVLAIESSTIEEIKSPENLDIISELSEAVASDFNSSLQEDAENATVESSADIHSDQTVGSTEVEVSNKDLVHGEQTVELVGDSNISVSSNGGSCTNPLDSEVMGNGDIPSSSSENVCMRSPSVNEVSTERRNTLGEVYEKIEITEEIVQEKLPQPTPFLEVPHANNEQLKEMESTKEDHTDKGVANNNVVEENQTEQVNEKTAEIEKNISELIVQQVPRGTKDSGNGTDEEPLLVSKSSAEQVENSAQPAVTSQTMSATNVEGQTKVNETLVPTNQILQLNLSSDVEIVAGLEFPLGPPTSAEPPKEKPPPPPTELSDDEVAPEFETDEGDDEELVTSLKRLDSTKRIKKEIRRKRSDFLGIEGGNDDNYLEPELKLAPPPDMTSFLMEEQRSEKQLYRQSICSETDSYHGETTESRDSGVELDRAHSDDWPGKQSSTPEILSAQHSRQNSDIFGTASVTSEEDEIMKKEREIIEILEKEEQWRYRNKATAEENDIGEKLAEKLHQLEQEKMRLEWERTEEENRRQMKENARIEEEMRLKAKEEELRQQESVVASPKRKSAGTSKEEFVPSGEALQAERERLRRENEELVRKKETLLLREQQRHWNSSTALPNQHWTHETSPVPQTHLSLQDISVVPTNNINVYHLTSPTAHTVPPLNYRLSLPDLQQEQQMQSQQPLRPMSIMPAPRANPNCRPQPPIPPAKPLRVVSQEQRERENSIRNSRMPSADSIPQHAETIHHQHHHAPVPSGQPLSRQTLQALSAVPRSRFISNDMWMQPKKKPENQRNGGREQNYNYQHWLIQEAEHRRITEQQQRNSLPPRKPPSQTSVWNTPSPSPRQDKPLPDSIIQTLTQRVQNRVAMQENKTSGVPARRRIEESPCRETPTQQMPHTGHMPTSHPALGNGDSQEKMLSVSGKKKCSHCGEELGRGAAMIIESLRLFYHIDCFKCCVCHVQLGDGLMGTDVRVRNNKLHCHNCYSSDDGVKFSCV